MSESKEKIEKLEFEDIEIIEDKELGKGGYAMVKLAKLKKDGSLYAVKIIDLSLLSSREHKHMEKEIENHKKLNHPNIIKFKALIQTDDKLYMLLEYAPHGDLYKYILTKKKFPEKEACGIIVQVAQALDYIHHKGILHRDLKPENILLDAEYNVKLSDFGWCGEYKREFRTKNSGEKRITFCGTYEYMAPEIIKGDSQSEKVDIWSLGILLFELLHGKTPFRSSAPLEIQRNIIDGVYTFDPKVSLSAVDLIRRILKPEPADRLSIQQILVHPLIEIHYPDITKNFKEKKLKSTKRLFKKSNQFQEWKKKLKINKSKNTLSSRKKLKFGKKKGPTITKLKYNRSRSKKMKKESYTSRPLELEIDVMKEAKEDILLKSRTRRNKKLKSSDKVKKINFFKIPNFSFKPERKAKSDEDQEEDKEDSSSKKRKKDKLFFNKNKNSNFLNPNSKDSPKIVKIQFKEQNQIFQDYEVKPFKFKQIEILKTKIENTEKIMRGSSQNSTTLTRDSTDFYQKKNSTSFKTLKATSLTSPPSTVNIGGGMKRPVIGERNEIPEENIDEKNLKYYNEKKMMKKSKTPFTKKIKSGFKHDKKKIKREKTLPDLNFSKIALRLKKEFGLSKKKANKELNSLLDYQPELSLQNIKKKGNKNSKQIGKSKVKTTNNSHNKTPERKMRNQLKEWKLKSTYSKVKLEKTSEGKVHHKKQKKRIYSPNFKNKKPKNSKILELLRKGTKEDCKASLTEIMLSRKKSAQKTFKTHLDYSNFTGGKSDKKRKIKSKYRNKGKSTMFLNSDYQAQKDKLFKLSQARSLKYEKSDQKQKGTKKRKQKKKKTKRRQNLGANELKTFGMKKKFSIEHPSKTETNRENFMKKYASGKQKNTVLQNLKSSRSRGFVSARLREVLSSSLSTDKRINLYKKSVISSTSNSSMQKHFFSLYNKKTGMELSRESDSGVFTDRVSEMNIYSKKYLKSHTNTGEKVKKKKNANCKIE